MSNKASYDYLIVGSGLYGAVFAHEATKAGKTCLVLDRRGHSGGNVYCENIEGINVHTYGPHIFHTNDKDIWDYVNSFVPFNRFTNSPLANYKGELYNLPFNMNTFKQLWGISTPEEAKAKIKEGSENIVAPANIEEQALSQVGKEIYTKLIQGYTEKQWGRQCTELPASIIKRVPVRYTYNNNYYNDTFQGIPIGGYNKLIDGLLHDIEVIHNVDYLKDKDKWSAKAKKIIYTGRIDAFYNFCHGTLAYRSMRWENEVLETSDYQGNAIVNYTEKEVPYTRIIEHKHFEFGKQAKTVISKEFSAETQLNEEPHYPIADDKNLALYNKYKALGSQQQNILFGGRLATYKYYDMHQVIAAALAQVKKEI